MRMRHIALLAVMALAGTAWGAFTIEDNEKALTVLEDGKPVLVYNYTMVDAPPKVDKRYRRACYVHPLYGLDGEVMTQDFPFDHYHHRGLFWAWPKSTMGEKALDLWTIAGVRQHHEAWVTREAGDDKAEIAITNVWLYDDAPETPVVRESVRYIVHPAGAQSRAIDFTLRFENVSAEGVTIRGATTDNKGYGGFCYRPAAKRKPMHFTAAGSAIDDDLLRLESPWVDVSFEAVKGGDKQSGVAIFQHPSNPGYPHPGWILRHYGFLGCSWPHTEPCVLQPGNAFELRYRLLVHRGTAGEAGVAEAFGTYTTAQKKPAPVQE